MLLNKKDYLFLSFHPKAFSKKCILSAKTRMLKQTFHVDFAKPNSIFCESKLLLGSMEVFLDNKKCPPKLEMCLAKTTFLQSVYFASNSKINQYQLINYLMGRGGITDFLLYFWCAYWKINLRILFSSSPFK